MPNGKRPTEKIADYIGKVKIFNISNECKKI